MEYPVGFHFRVELGLSNAEDQDNRFQDVGGLSAEISTEELVEGGENRFSHQLPVRTSFSNLVLKRALAVDSELVKWCTDAIEYFDFSPTDVTIELLDKEHNPLMSWYVVNAYPVKWNVSNFNAESSALVIETIELKFNYFFVL